MIIQFIFQLSLHYMLGITMIIIINIKVNLLFYFILFYLI